MDMPPFSIPEPDYVSSHWRELEGHTFDNGTVEKAERERNRAAYARMRDTFTQGMHVVFDDGRECMRDADLDSFMDRAVDCNLSVNSFWTTVGDEDNLRGAEVASVH